MADARFSFYPSVLMNTGDKVLYRFDWNGRVYQSCPIGKGLSTAEPLGVVGDFVLVKVWKGLDTILLMDYQGREVTIFPSLYGENYTYVTFVSNESRSYGFHILLDSTDSKVRNLLEFDARKKTFLNLTTLPDNDYFPIPDVGFGRASKLDIVEIWEYREGSYSLRKVNFRCEGPVHGVRGGITDTFRVLDLSTGKLTHRNVLTTWTLSASTQVEMEGLNRKVHGSDDRCLSCRKGSRWGFFFPSQDYKIINEAPILDHVESMLLLPLTEKQVQGPVKLLQDLTELPYDLVRLLVPFCSV